MQSTLKIIVFLALIYVGLQTGFQCNIDNCQACSYPNICGLCNNNYVLTLNTTSGNFYCNPVSCPSNCQTCYQSGTCQVCSNTYFLTSNGSCSQSQSSNSSLSTNCLWGSSNSSCSLCSYGYSLKSSYCYPNITILAQDQNCQVKMTSSICQICQTGYIVNFLGKCVQNQGISSCNIANCAYCQNANSTCLICNQGYQLSSSGSCLSNGCNINGCSVCANSNQCQTCQGGYILTANKTCQQVGYGCNIQGCQTCSSAQNCGQCSPGYQLSQFNTGSSMIYLCKKLVCPFNITNCNSCVQNYNTIFQYNQILCAPNSCAQGYSNVNGYCVANLNSAAYICSISNCLSCSYPNFCSQCQSGYSLTRSGSCQINICNVQNCQSCSVNNICQHCVSGYTLTIGNLTIQQPSNMLNFAQYVLQQQCTLNTGISCTISNCAYCLSNNVCASCYNGYDFDNSGVNCVVTCNVANCYTCSETQNVTTASCNICKPGYTLSSNGMQCNPISFSCSSGCSNSTGSCVYNTNTNKAECLQCNSLMILYNGQCSSYTCNIYGCEICAPWASANSLCLQCQQSLVLADGYCITPNCNDSVPNCVNCIENGRCVGCQEGFYLQNSTNGTVTCVSASSISNCNVENCLQCQNGNPNQCALCASPYVNNTLGQCVCKFQNCLDCSTSALACNSCPAPLFASLQDPNCVPQPSLNNNCTVNNCQACFTNGQCSLCAIGYSLNTADYSCQLNNCSALGLNNCQLCDQFGYECHLCNTGYMIDNFLEGGSCYPINNNYSCNITGCAVCSSSNNSVCSSCLPTYYSNGSTSCLPFGCNISNCYLCLANNTCTVCDTGYYLTSSTSCQPKFTSIVNCQNQIAYCDICVSGLYNSINNNFCIKCQNGFQFNSALNLCVAQSNSIPNCKVQLPNYNLNNLPLCMVCEQGYFVNSWGLCSIYNPQVNNTGCSVYNCLYCALNSSTCSFCFSPWGISQTGFCQTNSTGVCGGISNCVTCTNATNCVTCATTYLPYLGSCVLCNIAGCSSCQQANNCTTCVSGYQLNTNNGFCISCNINNCVTCSNNNVCSQCQQNFQISSSGSSCVSCGISNCASCTEDSVCGVCNNGYQLYQSSCITCNVQNCNSCNANNFCASCAQGYSLINGACSLCTYPCQTCNSNGSCATCATPSFISTPSSNGSCIAATIPNCVTYSSTNNSVCSTCSSSYSLNMTTNTCILSCNAICASCSSSNSNVCLTCSTGFYLANNTCNQCQSTGCSQCNSNACTTCMNGFYLISGECKPCPGYCTSCSSATVCTQLAQSNQKVLLQINSQTVLAICPQSCPTCSNVNPSICLTCFDGFYLGNNICQPCNIACKTCGSNPNQCLSCYPNNFLINNTCTSCSTNCQSCLNSSSTSACTSCFPGFYLSNQQCIQGCPQNCLTCSASSVCTNCASGYTLFLQTSTQTLCAPCITNCRTCAQGLPASCLSCGNGFYLSGTTCQACATNCQTCNAAGCSSCIEGYFLTSSLTCSVNCQIPCATCSSNNPTKCSSCIAGYTYNSLSFSCSMQTSCAGACSACPIGYILQNGQCSSCTASNCQICSSSNLNQCLSCAPGFYLNTANNNCQACLSSCSTCLRGDGCLTCSSGYTYLANVNMGASGYQCVACTYPCATCQNSPQYCTSCVSGYTFTGWKCTQSFFFSFTVTLLTNANVFNQNYYNFILALSNSIGSSNPNIITITGITFGSVNVEGGVAPTVGSGTLQSNQQFNSLDSTLSKNNNIAGMTVGSASITVIGGSIDYSKINLALILGICIPVGVLLIAGIALYIYCRRRNSSDVIDQKIKQESGFTVRESFQLSTNYKDPDTHRPFQEFTSIN